MTQLEVPGAMPSSSASPPLSSVPSVPARRFCGACGGPLSPDGRPCPTCRPNPPERARGHIAAGPRRISIRAAASMYFALLGISLSTAVVAASTGADAVNVDVGATLAQVVVVTLFAASLRHTVFARRSTDGGPSTAAWMALGVPIGVVTFGIASVAVAVINAVLDVPDPSYAQPYLDAGWGWGGAVVMIAVMPAVFEEIAFRGVIQQALRPALSVAEAVIVQALLFAILHLSVFSVPHLAVMGLALGILRARSGSLLPGIVVHFTHNALCVAGEWWHAASAATAN